MGMLFFSNDDANANEIEARLNSLIEQEGSNASRLENGSCGCREIRGRRQRNMPDDPTGFIGANDDAYRNLAFERKLFIIRKQAENWARERGNRFYFASLSSARSFTRDC